MLLGQSITLSAATLIARGQNENHKVYLRTEDTGITIGGSAAGCDFPLKETDPQPFEVCLQPGEELYADGTGDIFILETGLSSTPDL